MVAGIHVQQSFFGSRMALEQEVVVDEGSDWPQHSDAAASCWLHTVAQNLTQKKN